MKFKTVVTLLLLSTLVQAQENPSATQMNAPRDVEDTFLSKKFMNSVIFGVGAGTLVGIVAVTGFQKNFRQHLDFFNVSRGVSYGLYGGILLGLYVCYWKPDDSASNNPQENYYQNQNAENSLHTSRWKLALHPTFEPTLSAQGMDGVVVKWTIPLN